MKSDLSIWHTTNKELSSGFHAYLNYVYTIPALSAQEESELFDRYQKDNHLASVRTIILSHLRFVAYVAKSYTGYGLPLEDLVQEGTMGLMKSVKQFDPSKGIRLASFAVHWIKSEIHEYVIRNWKLVKVATTKAQRKLFFNLRSLKKKNGWMNAADAKEIATYLKVEPKEVVEMESRMYQADSHFDASFGDSTPEERDGSIASSKYLEDHSQAPEQLVLESESKHRQTAEIRQFISTLDERSKDILESRWLVESEDKLGLKALSEKHKVSMERIRQIESMTLARLRQHLEHTGLA